MKRLAGKLMPAIRQAGASIKEGAKDVGRKFVEGVEAGRGINTGRGPMSQSVFSPTFAKEMPGAAAESTRVARDVLGERGFPGETGVRMAGAYSDRLVQDIMGDGTRRPYWRYNHPAAIGEELVGAIGGPQAKKNYNYVGKGNPETRRAAQPLFALGAAAAPATAYHLTGGHFDVQSAIENPDELGRPKGFKQQYTEKGGPYTKTTQPGLEALERGFFGRRGRPLKFKDAQAEIPDLTGKRYGDFMRYKYQDRGLTGLGLIKATRQNLKGDPEASVVGFPVTLPSVGGFVGAGLGMRAASSGRNFGKPGRLLGGSVLGTAIGAIAGYGAGKLINMDLSTQGKPDPMTTREYRQSSGL
jgi:hypothetical protein